MMKNLADVLTKNPLVVVGMFLFTIITGVSGMVVGWGDLYRDFLSKSVTVPTWFMLLVVFAVFLVSVVYGTRKSKQLNAPLELVADKKFGVQQITANGKNFLGCEFHGTEIIFDGEAPFGFDRCEFVDPRFTFVGPAGRALMTLADLFKDPSFRPVVEGVILNIRAGRLPIAVKPINL